MNSIVRKVYEREVFSRRVVDRLAVSSGPAVSSTRLTLLATLTVSKLNPDPSFIPPPPRPPAAVPLLPLFFIVASRVVALLPAYSFSLTRRFHTVS